MATFPEHPLCLIRNSQYYFHTRGTALRVVLGLMPGSRGFQHQARAPLQPCRQSALSTPLAGLLQCVPDVTLQPALPLACTDCPCSSPSLRRRCQLASLSSADLLEALLEGPLSTVRPSSVGSWGMGTGRGTGAALPEQSPSGEGGQLSYNMQSYTGNSSSCRERVRRDPAIRKRRLKLIPADEQDLGGAWWGESRPDGGNSMGNSMCGVPMGTAGLPAIAVLIAGRGGVSCRLCEPLPLTLHPRQLRPSSVAVSKLL